MNFHFPDGLHQIVLRGIITGYKRVKKRRKLFVPLDEQKEKRDIKQLFIFRHRRYKSYLESMGQSVATNITQKLTRRLQDAT
jgi:hypothetical protein